MLSPLDEALICLQDALLFAIHPNLRAVQIHQDEQQKNTSYYFYYDCPITDEIFELASVAVTEAWSPDYSVKQHILELPISEAIPVHGIFAFLRKESFLPNIKKRIPDLLQTENPTIFLLLVVQEVLLGKVTPSLRIVTIDVNTDENGLYYYFEYDSPVSKEDHELVSQIVREASASFPGYTIHSLIQPVGGQNQKGKRTAYLRWEPDPDTKL